MTESQVVLMSHLHRFRATWVLRETRGPPQKRNERLGEHLNLSHGPIQKLVPRTKKPNK